MTDALRWLLSDWVEISRMGLLGALSIGWWLRGRRDARTESCQSRQEIV